MKALVVYDSAFGNTEKIAKIIGEAIESSVMRAVDVKAQDLQALDVLIVGSPTQAFQPLPSVKTFLKTLEPQSLQGVKIGSFDTRADLASLNNRFLAFLVKLFGYAAEPIAKQLVKKGGLKTLEPMGFFVSDKEGPLKEGELERAATWAKQLQS
ncbi:MAG: flavodoxin family protein [Spirochaetia bacterium]|nr:flavodoxin family protein [Spirochaetia bacterium]